MKSVVVSLALISSISVMADTSSLLNQAGSDIDFSSQIQVQKQLKLDNPFVIQLFSAWKVMGPVDMAASQWIELILDKQHDKALSLLSTINSKDNSKLAAIKNASELYLHYQTGNIQTFLSQWIELASSTNFLQTEFGIALDQIIGSKSTQLLMENGFYITADISQKLKKIESTPSKLNYSLQAMNALRTRENAVGWIGKLEESDPLRMPLAQTALLHYARAGKIGASGKIIKEVVEPILNKSNDEEEISLYFMTLGRLLYQAGALSESKKYYDLIPESSSYFLKAKTEALWAHLREKDYAKTKGELATLELNIFNDKFYPEAYVVSAMANVMLCQFNESRAAINRFIEVNKQWAREIEKNLVDPKAQPITKNFFIANLERAKSSILKEKSIDENKKKDLVAALDESIKREINSQWNNRKTILETALYKMKFVKIELISRMRAVEMNMKIAGSDEV
ncbi:MAG: hypothetical protein EHM20_12545, partial [Alphaproteobacteria bacterium]